MVSIKQIKVLDHELYYNKLNHGSSISVSNLYLHSCFGYLNGFLTIADSNCSTCRGDDSKLFKK